MRIFRRVEKAADLRETGIPGRGMIESLKLLQQGEFRLSADKVDEMMRGEGSPIRARIGLRVEADDGREPYEVEIEPAVPVLQWARLGIGGVVPVLIDPKKAGRVEIDWDGEIIEPTLEQRAEHDPVLKAMLDRKADES